MALRTETKTCALLILWIFFAGALWAQSGPYEVRHRHLHNGRPGLLHIDSQSISFEERGTTKHSLSWQFDDIRQLVLGTDTLRVVSYEDNRWLLGRDRIYVFDRLPAALVADWYPIFRQRLDQRFVAALADDRMQTEWQIPAKSIQGRGGSRLGSRLDSQGIVLVGPDGVIYKCGRPGQSRTWRITDLINVSSSDAFDLTITTRERDFRFQLKHSLPEARYNELWRRINLANGLEVLRLGSQKEARQ